MATTDTGPLGVLVLISVDEVDPEVTGTPTHLRVRYSLDVTGASESLTGFLIWHDNEAGGTTPNWVNACDAVKAGGGDGGDPVIYEVLVPNALSTTNGKWWESFEEYTAGAQGSPMELGGTIWNGGWSERASGYSSENFESYTVGTHGSLSGGTGWNGDWA